MHRLTVSGSPTRKGLQHGEAMRQPIRELAEIREALLRRRMPAATRADIEHIVLEQLAVLERHPALYAEFSGISRASGVSLQALFILNNYTDIRDFNASDEGCSCFVHRDEDVYLCGQTWDMHASARPYVMHLRHADDGLEILTLTGCLAMAGVNRRGMGVFINNLNCRETAPNLMWPAIVRNLLAAPSEREARQGLLMDLPCSGHNYLVCGEDEILNLETTGRQVDLTAALSRGTSFHTNHYLGRLSPHEWLERRSASSVPRYQTLSGWAAQVRAQENLSLERLASELCSRAGAYSVLVPFSAPEASMTCGGILFDRTKRTGVVFSGAYDDGDHSHFSIAPEPHSNNGDKQ
jgi:isopenicillin-N N-acyltransferase-like protein